jgi:hypothetical protein
MFTQRGGRRIRESPTNIDREKVDNYTRYHPNLVLIIKDLSIFNKIILVRECFLIVFFSIIKKKRLESFYNKEFKLYENELQIYTWFFFNFYVIL